MYSSHSGLSISASRASLRVRGQNQRVSRPSTLTHSPSQGTRRRRTTLMKMSRTNLLIGQTSVAMCYNGLFPITATTAALRCWSV